MTGVGTVTGVVGRVKWSYYVAAAINGYTLAHTHATGAWRLKANVVMADSFKMKQRPLVFEAAHAKGAWRFPVEEFDIQDGVMHARLGKEF